MSTSLTSRDFFNLVIEATTDTQDEKMEQMHEYALAAIAKLDAKNAARKANPKPSKSSKEAADRRVAVLGSLSATELMNRDQVAEACGITQGQATAALTALVKEGLVSKTPATSKAPTLYVLVESAVGIVSNDEDEEA